MKVERQFYQKDTIVVAKELLGKYLVKKEKKELLVGKIVEVEAYCGPDDLACHAARGKTNRNAVMFRQGGFTYVYLVYGMHYMLNVVTEKKGYPAAVLIRALQPVKGISLMKKRRNVSKTKNLCNGPGRLTQAFGLTGEHNGIDLTGSFLFIEDQGETNFKIGASSRIRVEYAEEYKDKPWRFFIKNSKFLSQ